MSNIVEKNTSFMVSIFIYGDDLQPALVSEILGVSPTKSWIKGEERDIKTRRINARSGLWQLKATTESNALDDHFDELFSQITTASVCDIPGVERAKLDILFLIGAGLQPASYEIGFSANRIKTAAAMGLEISLTVGVVSSDTG